MDNTYRILYERERTRRRVLDYLLGALTRAQLREESDNVADLRYYTVIIIVFITYIQYNSITSLIIM